MNNREAPLGNDVLVIGAGFGGLAAALALSEEGASVCLSESLRYPGGCASSFRREGASFDAGATLVSGLGRGQLFGDWLARYAPDTRVDWIDPLVELRAAGLTLTASRDRAHLVEQLCARPGAPTDRVRAFFAKQASVADVLWQLFEDIELLPPFSLASLARHATRALRYAPLLPLLGRSLGSVLAAYGIADFAPLRLYIDALCQITVQCPGSQAEATFALAAMDYYYRGTGHVRGGVGTLAEALLGAAARSGADVRLSNRVVGLRRDADGIWVASTRHGEIRARTVVANLLPSALSSLLAPELREARDVARLREDTARIEDGWGAAMLYVVARPPASAPRDAHHLQLVDDPSLPLCEGNHVFVSASSAAETERAPPGRRALTISTHVPLANLRSAGAEVGGYVASVHSTMRRTLEARAPEWWHGVEHELTASPRTFARFVGRPSGAVGGIPRSAGLSSYAHIGPRQVLDGVWLVGDSVFPGQSALATAIGGTRAAADIARHLGSRRPRASYAADVQLSSATAP